MVWELARKVVGLESVAVGSEEFIDNTIEELGPLFSKRKAAGEGEQYELHERQIPFNGRSIPEIGPPGAMNAYLCYRGKTPLDFHNILKCNAIQFSGESQLYQSDNCSLWYGRMIVP